MPDCLSSSMTGSTDAGPLQPQEDPAPLSPATRSPSILHLGSVSEDNGSLASRGYHRCQPRRKMTSGPSSGQAIQLTPLWEHVVRTRRFPSEVDVQATFVEISERLRDPEWEVRQHALRVLMDVLPTLNTDAVDEIMQSVVPELINNLGHPAPAVRKGALDTLRVYLVHSPNRDSMVKNILHDGLNRPDAHNSFQTNVTTGVILSAPLLLFPSSGSPPPTTQSLKDATIAFASRLVQVPHQEAVLKSLMKIRDAVGEMEFESYLADYDDKLKRNIDVLSKIYNIKPGKKKQETSGTRDMAGVKQDNAKERSLDKSWDSDSDTSGIAEEEDEAPNTGGGIPSARIVLETEIKFNEETAITMTILEEKDENDSENDEDRRNTGANNDVKNDGAVPDVQRRTPRRVRFGGEIVKLRTPDSDETESIETTSKTRIPLPVSPATKMPETTRRRPSSQPCSPHTVKRGSRRASRSASSSPKRETYTHNAQLSPKKSILTRTNGDAVIAINPAPEEAKCARSSAKGAKRSGGKAMILDGENPRARINSSREIDGASKKDEEITLAQVKPGSSERATKTISENDRAKNENDATRSDADAAPKNCAASPQEPDEDNETNAVDPADRNDASEDTSKRERNSAKPSPRRRTVKENRDSLGLDGGHANDQTPPESDFSCEPKTNVRTNDSPFGSPVNDRDACDAPIDDPMTAGDFVNDNDQLVHTVDAITNAHVVIGEIKYEDDEFPVRNGDGDGVQEGHSQHDGRSVSEGNGSVTCSSSEGEGKPQEPNWEELGLVGQEVLDDLHNKDDWRARVRGLERVASALRTSSALIAIESRLGSLLHAVLGGERSCRVAAAGLAVAKVAVAGVSEDALRRKLPQLAWGLARQGGPAAAQLARIAMLRLKPSLLLEQLLQSHCLCARNAKTRENALQLLIFSLVTFPSTEFNLDNVASRVATMIVDQRRRVRQAALDTLAVLGQIYDPEEVLELGKRAAEGFVDADAMVGAIKSRLARKSLPLVSADGLVVYGLQISPTVQIATGPDVDWIVAGSGSVSPGTGRTRRQIIATSRSAPGTACRNESANNNNCENPWIERPNLVSALGPQSKAEQSTVWQILPSQTNDDNENELKDLNGRNINAGVSTVNLRFEEQLRSSHTLSNQSYDIVRTGAKNHKEIPGNSFEQKTRNRKDIKEVAKEKENATLRGESKIPVLSMRDRSKATAAAAAAAAAIAQNHEQSVNVEYVNSNSRKQTKDVLDNNKNRINPRQENVGSYAYQRRKRLQQEENQALNQTFDSHHGSYHPSSYAKTFGITNREYGGIAESRGATFSDDNLYGRFVDASKFTDKNENSDGTGGHQRSLMRNVQQPTFVKTYAVYERQRKAMDRNAQRLRNAPNARGYQASQNLDSQVADKDRNMMHRSKERRRTKTDATMEEMDVASSDTQENDDSFSECYNDPYRRRLRSLSPSQPHRQFKLVPGKFQATSMYDIDKDSAPVNEEEYNARNKRHFSFDKNYHKQNSNNEEFRYQVGGRARKCTKSASSSSSDVSRSDRRGTESQDAILRDYRNDNSESSTPRSQDADDPAFDVITQQTANHRQGARDDVDSFFTPLDIDNLEYPLDMTNAPTMGETSKEWSSEDDAKPMSRIGSISRHSNYEELIIVDENCNRSTGSGTGAMPGEQSEDGVNARRRSIVPLMPNERIVPYEDAKVFKESPQSKTGSPKKLELSRQSPGHNAHHSPISSSSSKRSSRANSRGLTGDIRDPSEGRVIASMIPDEDASVQSSDNHPAMDIGMTDNSPAIIIASRPHSHDETVEYIEDSRNIENSNSRNKVNVQESTEEEEESSVNDALEDRQNKDGTSETNTEPGILKIESQSVEAVESSSRGYSKVGSIRGTTGRYQLPNKKATEKPLEKSNRMVQQCFAQLENKDWEITMRGLKALSQISKQHPEYLDTCAAGVIGRLLGQHIRSLRSQVARAACLAAGDIFSSQIRGIDQDLDDIAGPLLHRTADTNRFLRADSNAALDQMVQHLPPHKTIGIIVLRGASHQNAIVRAATARLLSDITDRIGPNHIMILPRDTKDKLLNTGAKLLMDGNLDTRNHTKRMFRRLTRCEGFRKALTDAVPETTLRHIDKTMKTL